MKRLTPFRARGDAWIAVLAAVLAFAFLGSRGIWDPDEGRYTNVAINMVESGNWLDPHRSADVGHWSKPPLTYWAIAASVGTFGLHPWAARLPVALSYLLCTWLAWRIARRLAPGTQATAAVAYMTMLLPFFAANIVTTDYLLAACETLAMWAYVEERSGARRPLAWIALMWTGFALAFLTKGPPGLLPLLAVLLLEWLVPARPRALRLTGLALFVLVALPWYAVVVATNPGLLGYFLGSEVVERITTDTFGRNGQWYGWAVVYVPTLLLGTLPWTRWLWPWLRGLPAAARRWRSADARRAEAPMLLLSAWVLLPLLVFCMSRSRLPLYLLPLFVPLAILVAMQRRGRALPRARWLLAWAALLVAARFAAAQVPSQADASQWAAAIEQRAPAPVREVVFVDDVPRYGLRLHLDAEVEKIAAAPIPPGSQSRFNPVDDEDLATELAESSDEPGAIWICRQARWPMLQAHVRALGHRALPLGTPYRGRVIFRTQAATDASPD